MHPMKVVRNAQSIRRRRPFIEKRDLHEKFRRFIAQTGNGLEIRGMLFANGALVEAWGRRSRCHEQMMPPRKHQYRIILRWLSEVFVGIGQLLLNFGHFGSVLRGYFLPFGAALGVGFGFVALRRLNSNGDSPTCFRNCWVKALWSQNPQSMAMTAMGLSVWMRSSLAAWMRVRMTNS